MALSAYWVKFFKGAGFPLDVATKHAVVFTNNRIKPDMLPDLDKPSLKDMGIALMGDMIAILRYAKKVVEDTTCERFLVDTEDDKVPKTTQVARTIVKKVVAKPLAKSIVTVKPKIAPETKPVGKSPLSTVSRPATIVKKKVTPSPRIVSQVAKESPQAVKRKLAAIIDEDDESESDSEEEEGEWSPENDGKDRYNDGKDRCSDGKDNFSDGKKKLKLSGDDEKVGYTIIMPKGRTTRSQEILKKISEQKRTVFDRLGDSSVTSTTNLAEAANTTFNITGLGGNDVLKRNSSVFNRLGDKEAKITDKPISGILKNGTSNAISQPTQGILKNNRSTIGSTSISLKKIPNKVTTKSIGTMHADHEKTIKTASTSVQQLVRTTKKIRLNDSPKIAKFTTKVVRKVDNPTSKLASERVRPVPAKARLGLGSNTTTKQVTFDQVAKVAHIRKPGVFSRLGV